MNNPNDWETKLNQFPKYTLEPAKKAHMLQQLKARAAQNDYAQKGKLKSALANYFAIAASLVVVSVFTASIVLFDFNSSPNGNTPVTSDVSTETTGGEDKPEGITEEDWQSIINDFKGVEPLYSQEIIGDDIDEQQYKGAVAGLIANAVVSIGADGLPGVPVEGETSLDEFFNPTEEQLHNLEANVSKGDEVFSSAKYKWTRLGPAIDTYIENEGLREYLLPIDSELSSIHHRNDFKENYEKYASASKKLILLDRAIQSVVAQSWDPTPSFTVGDENLIGIEDRVALYFIDPPVAENPLDVTWHLWGYWRDNIVGNFQVVGESEQTGEKMTLVQDVIDYADIDSTHESTNDVDPMSAGVSDLTLSRYMLSHEITFPHPGTWRLTVYVGFRMYGQIVVEVD